MKNPGDQVQEVVGLLSNIQEDGTYVPPEDDDNYVPDVDNTGEQEIDEEEIVDETGDQEIDQEDVEDSTEENDEVEKDEAEEEDETTAEESEVQTINELASFLEVEEGQLYDIQIPLGDGLEPISIGKLKDSHMEVERSKAQLVNDRASFEQDVEQFKQEVQQNQNVPAMNEELMGAAVQMESIKQQFNTIDWDAFEQQDAAKAMLHQQKLERAYAQAENQYKSLIEGYNKKQKDAMEAMKVKSRTAILEKIPEWKDPKVFQQEGDAIGNILTEYGYTAKEISSIYEPRLSALLRDYMKLKIKSDKANTTVKKLRLTPKKLPSSSSTTKKVVKKAQLKKTIDKAKGSRDIRDKVGAVSQLINS